MSADAQALLDATQLFLRRHEQALASGDPRRAHEACAGLLDAIGATLPDEIGRIAGASERQQMARAVLEKRMSEAEGLAMQLRLALEGLDKRETDVLRLVALLTALRRTLRALEQTLGAFAREHGASHEARADTFDLLRAAREALLAQAPRAAVAALGPALRAALAEPLGMPRETPVADALVRWAQGEPRFEPDAARALEAALAEGSDEIVVAWSLLDGVERLANQAAMSPR